MNLVERAKNILLTPKTEWGVIEAETTPPKALFLGYVLPLAGFAALMYFLHSSIIGTSTFFGGWYRTPILWGIAMAVCIVIFVTIGIGIYGFIIDMMAPSFGGTKNQAQAMKVAAYAATAHLVGTVFVIIPWLGPILAFLCALYGLYLLYLGLPQLMKNPADKTIGYEAVVVIIAIVVGAILSFVVSIFIGGAALMGMGAASTIATPHAHVTYDSNSPMGKLEAYGKKMEEANKKMEAAQKSGDPNAQMAAAMGSVAAAMGGKPGVDPVQIDQLKPFVPDTFAGLPRKDLRTERGGVQGLMTAKAEGVYSDGSGKNVNLEVVDSGGASGLMGLASWMNVQAEKEDQYRRESTRKEGNRLVHEEVDKNGGTNKYVVVLADRFIITARGTADIGSLKSGVASLDLGKLESLK